MNKVLITGGATGIGKEVALALSKLGNRVTIFHLPGQDITGFKDLGIDCLSVDITSDIDLLDGFEKISKNYDNELDLLINNAGVANIGSGVLAGVDLIEGKKCFEINVFSTINVTKVFLPLLHKSKAAKIVNMSSSAVRVPVPTSGIYNMTKFCIEGFTKTLRYELAPFNIQVTAVEPGAVKTGMTDNAITNMEKVWNSLPKDIQELYGPKLKNTNYNLAKQIDEANHANDIANAIVNICMKKHKLRPRYTVGKEVKYLPFIQRILSEVFFEKILMNKFGIK